MGIRIFEHRSFILSKTPLGEHDSDPGEFGLSESSFGLFHGVESKSFNQSSNCYTIKTNTDSHVIHSDYCIGLDWLGKSGRYIYVEPKINLHSGNRYGHLIDAPEKPEESNGDKEKESSKNEICELDYLEMLLEVLSEADCSKKTIDLMQIDWEAPKIKINSKDDRLTPFLAVQFLNLLKAIVKKGLKKTYYKVQENLNCKIKGKVLGSQHIKQNVFKNRLTKTFCEYQVFGDDNTENRFLNKVFKFVSSYIQNNKNLFSGNLANIELTMNYCRPAFEHIGNEASIHELKNLKNSTFFKEYRDALKIGQQILKRFAYNISETVQREISTPPFWIDMPRLFELYVYQKLLKANPFNRHKILYQFSTYGNALDFLIKDGPNSMVIDAKYKLHYQHGQIHSDMRQVAGYARLNKVLDEVSKMNATFNRDTILPCVIIYPDMKNGLDLCTDDLGLLAIKNIVDENQLIKAYHRIYKLGIKLPLIMP